jgi:AraC-like DNA-binding protein
MIPLPLIRAERVANFAQLIDDAGVPPDRHLEAAGISPKIREAPAGFLPGQDAWSFLASATDSGRLTDFCLNAARNGDWRSAGWVRPLASAANLGEAIRAMCASYVRDIPMVRMGLQTGGPVAWFWRRRVANIRGWDGAAPAEQYMLSFMLEIVRLAAGADWLPDRLMLESGRYGWASETDALPGVRIDFDQPQLAFAIPLALLSLPVSIDLPPVNEPEGEPPPQNFADSLRRTLVHWVAVGLPSQQGAADRLEVSPRTLRRKLADEGTCWRELVHDALFAAALVRLRQDASVRELAKELGFSDTANFTRFFRNRAGVPPSAYRDTLAQATDRVLERQA